MNVKGILLGLFFVTLCWLPTTVLSAEFKCGSNDNTIEIRHPFWTVVTGRGATEDSARQASEDNLKQSLSDALKASFSCATECVVNGEKKPCDKTITADSFYGYSVKRISCMSTVNKDYTCDTRITWGKDGKLGGKGGCNSCPKGSSSCFGLSTESTKSPKRDEVDFSSNKKSEGTYNSVQGGNFNQPSGATTQVGRPQ